MAPGEPVEVVQANPSVRMRSQALDDIVHSVSVGRGPAGRAAKGVLKTLTPERLRRKALRVTQQHVVHGAPEQDGRKLHERAAPALQAGGRIAQRVPRARHGKPVGL